MAIISDNQINAYIDKLLNFVDGLPMGDNGKAYFRAKLLVDFLDTWQFDDEANSFTLEEYLANPSNPRFTEVQTTYGIKNTAQIERWIEGFKTALKKARGKALENHLKELDNLHPAFKAPSHCFLRKIRRIDAGPQQNRWCIQCCALPRKIT